MKERRQPEKIRRIHNWCMMTVLLLITVVHITAWNSKTFTDWYRLYVFPVWTNLLGRISNLFQGSAGEILIILGICLVLCELVLLPLFRIKRTRFVRYRSWNLRLLGWILIYIYGTETLNCYVMYHASAVEDQYFDRNSDYGEKELLTAYTKVVAKANELAGQVKRDADGSAVFDGSVKELYTACIHAMQEQGKRYPYLSGYYPNPKPVRASHFMSQQHLLGIYFPFTMEANYNTVMYPVNLPATICHEYSHLKGIIQEDEANFFGFAACIEAEDLYLQYSGYLSVLGYLAGQVRKSVPDEIRKELISANEQVLKDDVFLTEAQWQQVEKKAVFSTETINQATNVFLEKNLTMNGVKDGMESYRRVVRLVIQYYNF